MVTVTQVPALTTTHQVQSHNQQPVSMHNNTVLLQQANVNVTSAGSGVVVTQSPAQRNDNAKEKCRKFLTNLIDLSKREPAQVEMNVKTLIQELVDGGVGPEDFCKKLENLLNAAPQPCLVGFLKVRSQRIQAFQQIVTYHEIQNLQRSLPLLRQSLIIKETVIEGINPPSPTNMAFPGATITTTQIPVSLTLDAVSSVQLFHCLLIVILGTHSTNRSDGDVNGKHRTDANSNGAARDGATHRTDDHSTDNASNSTNFRASHATADDNSRPNDHCTDK